MQKKLSLVVIGLAAAFALSAQINAGTDTTICVPVPIALSADVDGIMGTTAYTVASTTWSPEVIAGTSINLNDDQVSDAQPIGFSFCFFGNSYTQFYIGSNGWIGFTSGQATTFASQTIPNTGVNVPKNCIMGPWQDWHPGTGNNVGNYIRYQTVGVAPNRKLIVTWDNVPMYSCINNLGRFQIVLFETTNLIRNNIFNKPSCSWASGNATQGIHNSTGTVAYTVPGRNSSNWTTTNQSWEYIPSGVTWTQNGIPIGNTMNLTVNPTQTTTYVATVALCNGTTYSDDIVVTVGSEVDFSSSQIVPTNCSNQVGSIDVQFDSNSAGPFTYTWEGIEVNSSVLENLDDGTYNVVVTDESNGCTYDASFIVAVNSTLDIVATDTDISCNGANDGSAGVSATSDFPGFTYLWSDPLAQTTPTIENLGPGLYTVDVTDADGCSASAIIVISEPSALNVNFSQTPISCPGGQDGSISALPSGGVGNYSLLWEGNILGNTLSNLAEGEYTVTVFDNNGCQLEATSFIDDPEPISAVFIVNAPSCAGIEDGIVSAQGTGGTGPYTYFWPSNGTVGAIVDGLTSGDYDVYITDNNLCVDTAVVSISPVLELQVDITAVQPDCFGNSNGSIALVVSGGTAEYSYQWNDADSSTTSSISNIAAGLYNVLIEDANGCQGDVEILLEQPAPLEVAIAAQNPLCNATATGAIDLVPTGGTSPYDVDWAGNQNGLSISNLNDGNYSFTLTDSNGCSVSGSTQLIDPSLLEGSMQLANALCNGTATGSATATVEGGTLPYNFEWSQNTNAIYFNNNLSAGQQSVTVTDANGCALTINFVIDQPDALSGTITTEQASCGQNDGSVALSADGGFPPYTYFWNNNASTNTTFGGLAAGSYTMVLEDANGCSTMLNYSVSEIPVEASFITNVEEGFTPLEVEFINTSSGANSYVWDFGDGSTPVVTTSTDPVYHIYSEEGNFSAVLYATYNGDCESIDSLSILAYQLSLIVKVPNVVSPNADNNNDTFRILSENLQTLEVLIFDRWGRQVAELKRPDDEWSPTDQADGTYFYTLQAKGFDGKTFELEGSITVVR